jgi:hypothetical protein
MTKWGEARRHYEQHINDETDECMIWPYSTSAGYGQVSIDGQGKRVTVLACEAKHGPAPPGHVVRHGPCHNSLCWNPRHLSWGTRRENQLDRHRDNTSRGRWRATVNTKEQMIQLRAQGLTQKAIAERFGCHNSTVSRYLKQGK